MADLIEVGKRVKQFYPKYAQYEDELVGQRYLLKYGDAGVKSLGIEEETQTVEVKKEQKKFSDLGSSLNLLEKNLGEAELKGPFAGRLSFLSSLTGGAVAPQTQDYEAIRKSMIGPLARAISGEVGVLTDRDISRAESLLPRLHETEEVRKNKLANLRQIISERQGGKGKPSLSSFEE